jgi:hypothetical protein
MERVFLTGHIRHIFELPLVGLSAADRTTLEAFFATCRGRIQDDIAFVDLWDNLTYTCRLDLDELALQETARLWSSNLRLIEVSGFKILKTPVATFPASIPFQGYRMGRKYSTVIQNAQDDAEIRYEDYSSSIQKFGVGGDVLDDTQATDLLDCWEGVGGPYKAINFTDPQTLTYYPTVHFVETDLVHTLVTLNAAGGFISSIRATLEELK